jgi:spore maturation protein CgeB
MMKTENITGTAGLVSKRRAVGRQSVAAAYVEALAQHKIIVVAQRDEWEDHFRLYEALISGALVMSDPITYLPYGVVDGTSIVIYHSLDDLRSKVRYYLTTGRGSRDRLRIARAGMRAALRYHSPGSHLARLMVGRWPDDLQNPVIPALTGSFFFSTNQTVP